MRDIAHGFFAHSPAMAGPLIGLLIFFVVFMAISFRVLRSRPSEWNGDAALPLDDHAKTLGDDVRNSEGGSR